MNIIFGKFGKSISFFRKKWGIIGGDYEPSKFLFALAEMNPDINFWLIGPNDFIKFKNSNPQFNLPNIIDIKEKIDNRDPNNVVKFFKDNNIYIDFALIMSGPFGKINYNEKFLNVKTGELKSVLNMFKTYCYPIVRVLNDLNVEFVEFGEDGRYIPNRALDLIKIPRFAASTKTFDINVEKFKDTNSNLPEIEEKKINIKDYEVDKFILCGEDPNLIKRDLLNKNNLISLYVNGVRGGIAKKKLKIINKFIFSNFKDAIIYGEWDEEELPIEFKDNFVNIPMIDLTEQMYETKYSLLFPVLENWFSSKFWKMIYFGIIPFYTKEFNVTNRNIPEFLLVNNPDELKEKIDYLENNFQFKQEIFNQLISLIDNIDLYNGNFLNSSFLRILNECNINYNAKSKEFKFNKIKILTK